MSRAAVLVLLFELGCRPASVGLTTAPEPRPDGVGALLHEGPLSGRLASYAIHAELDGKTHRVVGTETLRWRHSGVTPVTSIPLHLYMNAFKDRSTLFMRESGGALRGLSFARPDDAGWI